MAGAGAQIRLIGSGKYSDVFLVRAGRRTMAMRVSYYRDDTICKFIKCKKQGDAEGMDTAKRTDAVAVQNAFARFARGVLGTVSPHFVLSYGDVDVKSFVERLPIVPSSRLRDLTAFQKRYNNVCFMEAFSCDLTRFLTRCRYSEATLRAIVFQVLYTVAAMQSLLPGWRHNDLSTNNVLVKKLREPFSARYAIGDATWRVRDCPVLVALNDFEFVHVPGDPKLQNQRVTSGKYRVDAADVRSYDAHFFLKNVLRCIARKPKAAFPAATEFFASLALRKEDRQNEGVPGLEPRAVLANSYFDALRDQPPGEAPPPGEPAFAVPAPRG